MLPRPGFVAPRRGRLRPLGVGRGALCRCTPKGDRNRFERAASVAILAQGLFAIDDSISDLFDHRGASQNFGKTTKGQKAALHSAIPTKLVGVVAERPESSAARLAPKDVC